MQIEGPFLHNSFQVNIWERNGCTTEGPYKLQADYLIEVYVKMKSKFKDKVKDKRHVHLMNYSNGMAFYQVIELHPENKLGPGLVLQVINNGFLC